ncbi:relaxase/mobilization nuclease domain-containing protein [Sphingobium naphthae]|uniref:relaxase/mobilization nuclease domain-containing protein n=1 Tax=Sphingobium naphthae TaxID=1886786 RepID=UPI0037495688
MSEDSDFRVRPGKAKRSKAQGRNARGLVAEVLRVAAIHSGGRRSGGASRRGGQSSFGRGRTAFARSRLFSSGRRVMVKMLPVTTRSRGGRRMAPLSAHIAYLKREGVTRDGSPTRIFDAHGDRADDRGFAERCKDDRHHFRVIVSPEDAAELTDLREYTRDLVRQMEADLGTRLEWIAVDHWNTDNPHVHLLVRGVNDQGGDLLIARDYISHNLRSRAEELASAELGPKPEHEVQRALDREVTAERWTRLDGEIGRAADELGVIDLRPERPGPDDPRLRRLMVGRLQHLETMGLAAEGEPGRWAVAEGAAAKLRELGTRGDIIRTIGAALKEDGHDRALDSYAVISGAPEKPIAGRLIDKGLHDELTGTAYAVIDGTDGRTHHVRLPGIEALEHSPKLGGIVELRAIGRPGEAKPTLVLATRSDLDLAAQVKAPGATWLDHRLIERGAGVVDGGFGAEVRRAMGARTDHLVKEGLARRYGERTVFERGLLDTLRKRELDSVGAKIAGETGLAYRPAADGEKITGVVRQRLALASGRFAMLDDGLGFQLVPWTSTLEQQLGRQVSGVVRAGGGIDWTLGRKRDLGL